MIYILALRNPSSSLALPLGVLYGRLRFRDAHHRRDARYLRPHLRGESEDRPYVVRCAGRRPHAARHKLQQEQGQVGSPRKQTRRRGSTLASLSSVGEPVSFLTRLSVRQPPRLILQGCNP